MDQPEKRGEEEHALLPSKPEAEARKEASEELLRVVEEIEQHLSLIHRERHRVIEADERREVLTAPQRQAMIILAQAHHAGWVTLKELSERMGLAQSTVSGIVDRLERKALVHRQIDPADRRSTRLEVTEPVQAYLQRVSEHLHSPLLSAMQRASSEERTAVLTGLATLRRLLTEAQAERNT